MRQIPYAVRLNCVLIHGIAGSPSNAQILRRLEEGRSDRKPVHLGPQAVDNGCRRIFADIQRLQRNINEPAIRRAVAAGVRDHVGDGRICLDDLFQL